MIKYFLMNSGTNADSLLWPAFQQGDRDAFAAIYRQHFRHLYEYGLRIAADKDLVKDSIQDLFIKLWSNRQNLGQVKNVRSYLLVSLRGGIYNKLEKDKRTSSVEIDDRHLFELTFTVEASFIEKENISEQSRKLLNALNSLTPKQKEIIYLKYFEELEYDEIASIMSISVKATYKLSARAIEALREVMNLSGFSLLMIISMVREELFS